jgi:hypothetical protein
MLNSGYPKQYTFATFFKSDQKTSVHQGNISFLMNICNTLAGTSISVTLQNFVYHIDVAGWLVR